MDKETVVKHQFWFMLGGFLLLWLISLISLKVVAAPMIKKKKADYDGAMKKAKDAPGMARNESFWKPWEEHGAKYEKFKDQAWAKAWDLQKEVETWPGSLGRKLVYPQDEFSDRDRIEYRNDLYEGQVAECEGIPFPVQYKGGFASVFPLQKWSTTKVPTREECWLAQEDVWVRREMLGIVRIALDSIAYFHPVDLSKEKKEDLPKAVRERGKDILAHHRLRNYYFQVDLYFEAPAGGKGGRPLLSALSTIKNVSKDSRVLPLANPRTNKGIPFKFFDGRSGPQVFRVEGEPLAPGQSAAMFKKLHDPGIDLRKPFVLYQDFDWDTCPIRQIEEITLAKNCARMAKVPLKPREILKNLEGPPPEAKEGEDKGGTGGTGPGTGGTQPGGMSPGGAMGMPPGGGGSGRPAGPMSPSPPGMGAGGGGMTGGGGGQQSGRGAPADAGSKTPNNGMQRNRYVSVTPQCRHLPVVLKLVIEQPHIENVLAAVANDRLRIQITQVEVRHVGKVKTSGAIGDFVPGESMGNGKVMPGAMYPGAGSGGYPGAGSSGGRPGMMMPSAGPTGPAGGGSGDGPPKMRPPMPPAGGSGDGPRMRPPKSPGGTTSGKAAEGTTVQDPNMVELTIYGIAALYERFPPKPSPTPGEGGPDAPPAPGAR